MKKIVRKFFSFLILCCVFISCATSDNSLNSTDNSNQNQIRINHSPVSATLVFESDTVLINKPIGVTCIAEDPDENEIFSFEWTSFKVTENSTDDHYDFDYWKNRGEFIQEGPNTLWTPAAAEGKYIIFCLAKDKGGAEIFASKIINAKVGFGFTLITDTLLYYTNGTFDDTNLLSCTLTNDSEHIYGINACGLPVLGIEKKESDGWRWYISVPHFCTGDMDLYGACYPNSKIIQYLILPTDPGIYRLVAPYDIYPERTFDINLYSGEFEVVLE